MTQNFSELPQSLDARSLDYAEDFAPISEAVRDARLMAVEAGAPAISTGTAAFLTFVTKAANAKAIVEVGTGTGTSGLAFFAGMPDDGVLTSIDSESGWQADARANFKEAGLPTYRYRLITGNALDVLNNLRDDAYDIVFINGDKLEYVEYVAQAQRLLRHGGLVIMHDALWHGLVADDADESDETLIIREALAAVLAEDGFTSTMVPLGDGLLAAVLR